MTITHDNPTLDAQATGTAVWDRLWRATPDDAKDDAALDRERRSPRWALVVQKLIAAHGTLSNLRTIELGSGRGDLSALLAERGAQTTLLDQSARALDEARRRFARLHLAATFTDGDLLGDLDEHRAAYDAAISLGVIEHFRGEDRTRVLRAHYEVLRPGGLAIVSVPNAWCPPYRAWKAYLELRGWWPYGLEIPYSRRELLSRAAEAGFARAEVVGLNFWQSVGDHFGRSLLGRGPDWVDRPSLLDRTAGSVLVLFAWRGATVDGDKQR
jgi:SAM-dependent methyltransferase